ncbi:hypothetical protein [Mesorhizobium sp. M0676]|uniref:hypothetical protein n=1 Tax=Mesorhizobium sp. M0676 TaxID=2956984 RepID=UPI00333C85FD
MSKTLSTIAAFSIMYSLAIGLAHGAPAIEATSKSATVVERRFGTTTQTDFLTTIMANQPGVNGEPILSLGFPDSLSGISAVTNEYLPEPLYVGSPLIQTKGVILVGRRLFISDTGKDGKHKERATIWKFDLDSKSLEIFYRGPLLETSKWLAYSPGQGALGPEIIISDLGVEPTPRQPGTGEGAKVFAIPLNQDGTPGEPRIIFSGPPLRSPEGVAVVGDSIVLADWAAGQEMSRPEMPTEKFRRGKIFKIPLAGGTPVELFPEHEWVIVIGVDAFQTPERKFVEFIDIGSGRLDESGRSPLPYEGTPEVFRSEVISESPLELGPPERILVTEDSAVALKIDGMAPGYRLSVTPSGTTRFGDESVVKMFDNEDLQRSGGLAAVILRSDVSLANVSVNARILEGDTEVSTSEFTFQKPLQWNGPLAHPKKDSAIARGHAPLMKIGADGTTSSIFVFPFAGGTPGILWRGAPLSQPIGTQATTDGEAIYVTDQSAGPNETSGIFSVRTPSEGELNRMFNLR